ncbi:lanthionine synthetase C family protein [Glycomyces harbinensis]|uniref:Lanthionine synthetase C-like protein n=1 Tax=Glycomyces harbinensis TaxID=58114 RepID=A0A1G6WSR6_9ACTN|nr:lanthionine synthetase C family protein [Glycomyces harbinensis]SDD68922.1 Lanthionine synthetase C-like protein [Glycomyces harbinensis]
MRSDTMLPEDLRESANRMAAAIAHRLTDTDLVDESVRGSAARAANPFGWGGPSLFGGHAGQALLFEYAARAVPEEADRWRAAARESLRTAARLTQQMPLADPSIGYGTAGLASALAECEVHQPGYRRALGAVNRKLAEQIQQFPRPDGDDGTSPARYDAIQGAAGMLGHLVSVPDPEPAVRAAADRLVDDLTWTCLPVTEYGGNARWHVAPRYLEDPDDAARFPNGYLDLGLAHGIPGPLSALSRAWRAGYRRPAQREAIRHTADRLVAWSVTDHWGANWPRTIALDEDGAPEPPVEPVGRLAWCYGAPGVCAALLDAALALDDDELRATAVAGLRADLQRLREGRAHVHTAALCHGAAGLLAIAQKFTAHGDRSIGEFVPELTERVLAGCDPSLPLMVQQIHSNAPEIGLDSPGLLEGAAGVALTLWSASGAVGRGCHRALLID